MPLPAYFLPRPPMPEDAATLAAFEQLYAQAVANGPNTLITYTLAAPKWQFLCYLADTKDILLHGSGQPNIEEFEPRQSSDVSEFGNRRAVYAASDGIWPMFFAVMNREDYDLSLLNACVRFVDAAGQFEEAFYFFSITADALPHQPWRNGMVYILPRATFEPQATDHYNGRTLSPTQWASPVAVRPLARLPIEPDDFPFLAHIHPHEPSVIYARAAQNPDGFPWMDEELGRAE